MTKKSSHRFNTPTQSPNMTSREYLGDHLKERLRNRQNSNKSQPKNLLMVPPEYTSRRLKHSIKLLNRVLDFKGYSTKYKI